MWGKEAGPHHTIGPLGEDMVSPENIRHVLLNHMVSSSSTQASQENHPPIHGAKELLEILDDRRKLGFGIEYIDADDGDDERKRAANGSGRDFVRLKDYSHTAQGDYQYIGLLFELADYEIKSLSVVHTKTLAGREISGEDDEVGASTAHVLVRLPGQGSYDDGSYRCAIEYIQGGISRQLIAKFIRRQLRRMARQAEWSFDVDSVDKKCKSTTKHYRYWPKLELLADVGRSLKEASSEGRVLSHMLFTNRSEKREAGQRTSIKHAEYKASVDVRVNVSQGPSGIENLKNWVQGIRDDYKNRGYTSRLLYKNSIGTTIGGKVHKEIEGALDLLMCPKDPIYLASSPQRWRPDISAEVIGKLREIVDRDSLWQRAG